MEQSTIENRVTTLSLLSIVSLCPGYFRGMDPRTVPNNPFRDVGHRSLTLQPVAKLQW